MEYVYPFCSYLFIFNLFNSYKCDLFLLIYHSDCGDKHKQRKPAIWRKPSPGSSSITSIKSCSINGDTLGENGKQEKKKVSFEESDGKGEIVEAQTRNDLSTIVDACHVQKEERAVIKTWKSWLKDPHIYKVQKCSLRSFIARRGKPFEAIVDILCACLLECTTGQPV